MTKVSPAQIKETFTKISAWGRAIEAGNDGMQELAELKNIAAENSALMTEAIEYAEMCQSIASNADSDILPENVSHPKQRLARIGVLKTLLWPEAM